MKREWWYVVAKDKIQTMIYLETNKPIKKYEKYLFAEYYQSSGSLIAQQFLVEDESVQQREMFEEFGLTEKHRDHSVRKPVIRSEESDEVYEAV